MPVQRNKPNRPRRFNVLVSVRTASALSLTAVESSPAGGWIDDQNDTAFTDDMGDTAFVDDLGQGP